MKNKGTREVTREKAIATNRQKMVVKLKNVINQKEKQLYVHV